MPLFVCMPLYSLPHLILEGAPFSHAFKPLNKYKPTQELHFHLYILSIVLFFSSESPHIFGPVTGHFPWAKITNASQSFYCISSAFCPFSFLFFMLLVARYVFFFYPLFSFHCDSQSLKAEKKQPNIDYIPCITTLTLAEEFLETKKKNNCLVPL